MLQRHLVDDCAEARRLPVFFRQERKALALFRQLLEGLPGNIGIEGTVHIRSGIHMELVNLSEQLREYRLVRRLYFTYGLHSSVILSRCVLRQKGLPLLVSRFLRTGWALCFLTHSDSHSRSLLCAGQKLRRTGFLLGIKTDPAVAPDKRKARSVKWLRALP